MCWLWDTSTSRIPRSNLYPGRCTAEVTWKPYNCVHIETSAEAWASLCHGNPWCFLLSHSLMSSGEWLCHMCEQVPCCTNALRYLIPSLRAKIRGKGELGFKDSHAYSSQMTNERRASFCVLPRMYTWHLTNTIYLGYCAASLLITVTCLIGTIEKWRR